MGFPDFSISLPLSFSLYHSACRILLLPKPLARPFSHLRLSKESDTQFQQANRSNRSYLKGICESYLRSKLVLLGNRAARCLREQTLRFKIFPMVSPPPSRQ